MKPLLEGNGGMYNPSLNFKTCHFTYWVEKHVPVGILTYSWTSANGHLSTMATFFVSKGKKIHTLTPV